MKPNTRSITGALMMLAIIPIFAGLLACMPVPIGDPERSRIDPDISGVWLLESEEEFDALYLYQPYDRRTWLVVGAGIEEGSEYEGEPFDIETSEDALRVLETHPIGSDGITSPGTVAYKVWLKKLGGVTFMTWEPVGGFNEDGSHTPEVWMVFRVEKVDKNRVDLFMLGSDHEAFDDLVKPSDYEGDNYPRDMRRKWEKQLKKVAKNFDDEDLYAPPMTLRRLPDELTGKASELFQEVIEFDN